MCWELCQFQDKQKIKFYTFHICTKKRENNHQIKSEVNYFSSNLVLWTPWVCKSSHEISWIKKVLRNVQLQIKQVTKHFHIGTRDICIKFLQKWVFIHQSELFTWKFSWYLVNWMHVHKLREVQIRLLFKFWDILKTNRDKCTLDIRQHNVSRVIEESNGHIL